MKGWAKMPKPERRKKRTKERGAAAMTVEYLSGSGLPLPRLVQAALALPPVRSGYRVRLILLPGPEQQPFRRLVEAEGEDCLWCTGAQLRQGGLCRRLLRWQAEGFPPPDGVFVAMEHPLLPEDAADLCPAVEYFHRFSLQPALFCVVTDSPALGPALVQAWDRFAAENLPPAGD